MKLLRKQLEALGSIATHVGGGDRYTVMEAPDRAILVTHEATSGEAQSTRHHINDQGVITTLPRAGEKAVRG